MYKLSIQEVLSKLNVGQTGLNNNQVLKNRNGKITDLKGIKFYAKYNYIARIIYRKNVCIIIKIL